VFGLRIAVAAAVLANAACTTRHAPLRIAAAADLRFALEEIIQAFRQQHADVPVRASYGSSGNFYAQLLNRAPFDLFLSADRQYPQKLGEQGLVLPGSEFTYATGHIVLWVKGSSGMDIARLGMEALRQPWVHHIAIANPAHAPYGRAAEAALRKAGIYQDVQHKLVMGENIAQTLQLVDSGAAEAGIVALSLALAPAASGKGRYWEVPRDAYPRIEQGGAILKWSAHPAAAQAFCAFLLGRAGRTMLQKYGFSSD
jgi:molybdate transport system substrate-binding protein